MTKIWAFLKSLFSASGITWKVIEQDLSQYSLAQLHALMQNPGQPVLQQDALRIVYEIVLRMQNQVKA